MNLYHARIYLFIKVKFKPHVCLCINEHRWEVDIFEIFAKIAWSFYLRSHQIEILVMKWLLKLIKTLRKVNHKKRSCVVRSNNFVVLWILKTQKSFGYGFEPDHIVILNFVESVVNSWKTVHWSIDFLCMRIAYIISVEMV